jgi:hypothetical protein
MAKQETMNKLLTADKTPFTLGDTLWSAPYPQLNNSDRKPISIPTKPESMEVRNDLLFTTEDTYPGDSCLAEIGLQYSTEAAANEAYLKRLDAAVADLQAEIERVKNRRPKRRFHLYLDDFDCETRSPKRQYLTTLSAEGTDVTFRNVVEEFIRVKPELAPFFDRERLSIRGLQVVGQEIEP